VLVRLRGQLERLRGQLERPDEQVDRVARRVEAAPPALSRVFGNRDRRMEAVRPSRVGPNARQCLRAAEWYAQDVAVGEIAWRLRVSTSAVVLVSTGSGGSYCRL
jgi:hypothetical protein